MKKVLFTLALAAFGLIAGAQGKPAPVLAFGTDAENLITEIELAPGEQQEFQVILTEQQEAVVMGFQLQWLMKDANGALTEALTCPAIYPDDPDDPMDYYWTNPENLSTATTAVGGLKGNSLASSNPEFATWRWVATNTGRNQFWYPRNANVPPIAVGTMTIKAGADWTDDFATFELDLEYTLYNQTYETTPSSMAAYEARPEAPMVLTIRNKNAQPPVITVADPVIAFAEENNVLTVTVSCETADAVLTVNGEVVEGNPYSYTVEHTNIYEEQVVNVTAQAAVGDVTSEEVSDTYTFQAQAYEELAGELVIGEVNQDNGEFTVTYTGDENVTITCDMEKVRGTENTFQLPGYGTYEVTAKATATGAEFGGDYVTETATLVWAEPVAPGETTTFVKVTAADQLVAGKKYIFVYDNLAMGAIENNAGTPVTVTVNGDEVEAGENVMVFTLGGTQYMFTLAVGDQYLRANGGSNTGISLGASAYWKPAAANGGIGALSDQSDGARGIIYRASENCFRHYAKSNVGNGYEYGLLYVEKSDEPVLQDLTGNIVVSQPDENGVVTVTYDGPETVTITVNGQPVAESYQLEDGVPMTFDVEVTADGYNPMTASETRTWNKPAPLVLTGTLTIGDVDQATGQFVVTYDGDEEVTITCDMAEVTRGTDKTFTLPGYGTYEVTARATATDAAYNGDYVEASKTLTWTQPQTDKPTITVAETEDGYLITATGDGTVTLYVEDIQVAQAEGTATYTIPYNAEGGEYGVSATAQKPNEAVSDYALETVQDPGQTAKPTITYVDDPENHVVHVTATGYGTVTLYVEDVQVAQSEDGIATWDLPYTEDEYGEEVGVSATAQEDGQRVSDYAVETIEVPGTPVTPPAGQCAKPDGGYVNGADFHGVTVTLTNNETAEGTQLHYTVTLDGVVITEDAIYDGPFALTQDGEYQIDFWATAPNMQDSSHGGLLFTIDEETGLSELLSGKTIANVRYFNMAGQEMQEANGMTIIVTTYTDGTSSAVKVLK
jgi:hypothetical protein